MILTLIFDNFSKMFEYVYFFNINASRRTKNNTFVIADNFD